jgi:hypothetical protein
MAAILWTARACSALSVPIGIRSATAILVAIHQPPREPAM